MGDRDLPSDSDSNDEDYVPEGFDNGPLSEEESGQDSSEQDPDNEEVDETKKKRKKVPTRKRARKKLKPVKEETIEVVEKTEEKPEISAEEKKKKADALWADFLKDCDPPAKKKSTSSLDLTEVKKCVKPEEPAKVKVIEEYHFAGEKVIVEKEVPSANGTSNPTNSEDAVEIATSQSSITSLPVSTGTVTAGSRPGRGGRHGVGGGGISSILGQLSKKNKLSTLQKSKLDWDSFKKDEGIVEDLEKHNKGKNGYLERQDFLERTDLRQFEIEKNLRAAGRSSLR